MRKQLSKETQTQDKRAGRTKTAGIWIKLVTYWNNSLNNAELNKTVSGFLKLQSKANLVFFLLYKTILLIKLIWWGTAADTAQASGQMPRGPIDKSPSPFTLFYGSGLQEEKNKSELYTVPRLPKHGKDSLSSSPTLLIQLSLQDLNLWTRRRHHSWAGLQVFWGKVQGCSIQRSQCVRKVMGEGFKMSLWSRYLHHAIVSV